MAGLFGGGLMGRMMERTVGKAMEGAINSMGEQLRAAQSQAKSIKEEAARAIASDSEVLRHLGGSVQIADPVSQQSSTQIINGRTMQTVRHACLSTAHCCLQLTSFVLSMKLMASVYLFTR